MRWLKDGMFLWNLSFVLSLLFCLAVYRSVELQLKLFLCIRGYVICRCWWALQPITLVLLLVGCCGVVFF